MSEFLAHIEYEIDRKVRKSLKEQSARLTEDQIKELVDFRLRELAKVLVDVFDKED